MRAKNSNRDQRGNNILVNKGLFTNEGSFRISGVTVLLSHEGLSGISGVTIILLSTEGLLGISGVTVIL